jgi:hypothetical protein
MGPFVVDTNFFIQAHRVNYPLDVATSFWIKIRELAERGVLISIDKVHSELNKNNDALTVWCDSNLPESFFKDSSEALAQYGQITRWALSRSDQYLSKALNEFLDADEADAWLVSYALSHKIVLVTQEVSAPLGKAKIKIPDVCIQFGVGYINTIEMLRQLGERF